jgi:DMSO/TMAO reductase YedYZ molybdopterin-dependent catalytic subunit
MLAPMRRLAEELGRLAMGPAAMSAGLLVQAALHWGSPGAAVAPLVLAQAIISVLPGAVATPLIGLLEAWAMRLLVAGCVGTFLLLGLAGVAWPRVAPLALTGPWLLGVAAALWWPAVSAELGPSVGSALLAWAVVICVFGLRRPARPAIVGSERRRVIVALGALGVLAAGGTFLLRAAQVAAPTIAGAPLRSGLTVRAASLPDPADDPPLVAGAQLAVDLTSNENFYVVDEAVIDPSVDVASWLLRVDGHVRQSVAITYDELLALPAVEQVHTLECISNGVGGDLISNARWIGVPLRALLERAGVLDGAIKVAFASVEGYSSALALDTALDPRTLIAYGMNGTALPREHGFPARLLIPGRYGMKCVKWLARISPTTEDYLGFWERRGWTDDATVHTMSRIDWPPSHANLRAGQAVVLAGIAYAGAKGVGRVEVSTDDRQTWQPATVGRRYSDITWRRWAYRWAPATAGWYRLAVRAYDDKGALQIAHEQESLPFGATGIHSYQVEVR